MTGNSNEPGSVLMLAYRFPPEGNAGAFRPLRFVRQLALRGWRTSVIAARPYAFERYDPRLSDQVPGSTRVITVPHRDPWFAIQNWRARRSRPAGRAPSADRPPGRGSRPDYRSWLRTAVRQCEAVVYHPDLKMFWIRPAARAALEECRRHRPDVIWATGAPWSSFLVAEKVSRRTGIPYVLDFRSSWTLVPNTFEARRPSWIQKRDRRTLARLFAGAQAVVFFYDTEAECFSRAYPTALHPAKVHVIPNGFDGEVSSSPMPDGDVCRVLYAGVLSPCRYDNLLLALKSLRLRDPERAGKLRFLFVGEGTGHLAREAAGHGLADLIETAAPLPYAEVLRLQEDSHALLMLGLTPSYKGYSLVAGSKLFAYLKSGRPILGILPEDESRRVLHRLGAELVASVESVTEITDVLVKLVRAWENGALGKLVPDRRQCEAYSARAQTDDLIRALEGMPAADPFLPGSTRVPESLLRDLDLPTVPAFGDSTSRVGLDFPSPLRKR